MSIDVETLQSYDVLVGAVLLHLSDYKLVGGCMVQEQGTANGTATVTACFPKGTRLTLKGRLAPSTDMAAAAAALDMVLRSGVTRTLRVGKLVYNDARLIGFSFGGGTQAPEVMLLFHTAEALTKEAEA
ncbi:MAG: hypothetical protein K2I93_01955 [Oscillospiraceae bacterium]|nr:hypothetical protein [Oscillospiraceae bacterium]